MSFLVVAHLVLWLTLGVAAGGLLFERRQKLRGERGGRWYSRAARLQPALKSSWLWYTVLRECSGLLIDCRWSRIIGGGRKKVVEVIVGKRECDWQFTLALLLWRLSCTLSPGNRAYLETEQTNFYGSRAIYTWYSLPLVPLTLMIFLACSASGCVRFPAEGLW